MGSEVLIGTPVRSDLAGRTRSNWSQKENQAQASPSGGTSGTTELKFRRTCPPKAESNVISAWLAAESVVESRLQLPRPNVPQGTRPNQVFKVLSGTWGLFGKYFKSIINTNSQNLQSLKGLVDLNVPYYSRLRLSAGESGTGLPLRARQ